MIQREELSNRKRVSLDVLNRFKVYNRTGVVEFNYYNLLGEQGRTRLRTSLRGAGGSNWSPTDYRPIVEYANACMFQENSHLDYAFIVEGESDCWVLNQHSLLGIGIPGAENVECLIGSRLNKFSTLYLVQENNNNSQTYPGGTGKFIHDLVKVLKNTGYQNTVSIAKLPNEFEDISHIHLERSDFCAVMNDVILNARNV